MRKKWKSEVIATAAFVSAGGFAVIFISLKDRDSIYQSNFIFWK